MQIKFFKTLPALVQISSLCLLTLWTQWAQCAQTASDNITYNMAANPYFCLVNSTGQVPDNCTGPALSQKNIQIFSPFFNNNLAYTPILLAPHSRITPLMGENTNRTINNMIPLEINNNPSLAFSNFNPVLIHWQHIDKVVYFGGSESAGQVLLPTPGWIRAAHQNQAAILGTIFFSPTFFGGSLETSQLSYMLTPSPSGTYPVADLLINLAKTYGIDGYFINEETDPSQFSKFQGFISYLNTQSQAQNYPLHIEWYSVQVNTPNLLAPAQNTQISSSTFIDYGLWSLPDGDPGLSSALSNGYLPSDIEYGIDASQYTPGSQDAQLQYITSNQISAGEFNFGQVINPGSTAQNFTHSFEQQNQSASDFWQNANQIMPLTKTMTYTPPFNTYFNTGMGYDYFIAGQQSGLGVWSDIGLQELLPNQSNPNAQYIYSQAPAALQFQQDQTTQPYYGGSALNINLNPLNPSAFLYQHMGLDLRALHQPELIIRYQYINTAANSPTADLCLQKQVKTSTQTSTFCINLDNQPDNQINTQANTDNIETHWHKRILYLSKHSIINQIYLEGGKHNTFSLNLGQIYIGDSEAFSTNPTAPGQITITDLKDSQNPMYIHHIIQWQIPANQANQTNQKNTPYQYQILNNNGFLIGVTGNSAMDLIDQNHNANAALKGACIRAVNMNFQLYSACTPLIS